jgi:hypothetical protein
VYAAKLNQESDPIFSDVAGYRERYRQDELPRGYDGRVHLAITFGGGLLALFACLWQLKDVGPLEWLALPLSFAYANLAEYLGHRFPMHRPFKGLGIVYKRHAGQHHRFFSHEAMPIDGLRDLRAVLFPPVLVVFFFGLFATPAWFVLEKLVSADVAWLFVAGGIAYFLNYEVLHLAYHLPETHWLARLAPVRKLRWLHTLHHDTRRMARHNFNISYPVCDWLFGTLSAK